MIKLRVKAEFDAAHKIVGYKGKCANIHGHSWITEVFVIGKELDETGILVDYAILKERLKEITEKLDHTFLNDDTEIGNPTSENLAKYIYENMKNIPKNVKLEKVRVWESANNWCEYFE